MSSPFLGQITMFGGNFAPRGWAFCDGQLLPIAQNQALFSLLGTTYGGDGRTTFALPDLRSRAPMHEGNGNGLTNRRLGEKTGTESTTLSVNQLPSHNHVVRASKEGPDAAVPTNNVLAAGELYRNANPDVDMRAGTTTNTGGGQSFSNVQPVLVINFIIAMQGTFPSRN